MFEVSIAIACLCMWLCISALNRSLKRQEQEIRELKTYIKINYPEETRCKYCSQKTTCPAYDTGVIYPCPEFKEEE